ncbi:rhodanese-like domain-containing protein [Pseudomonadales bacterium]|jgi:rhodanese-related sulfurtransferase|nr:rhodanese-like domain-containing protein [Gammaproteobacteria bacterium]MDA7726140.1 rhodanese-like domain-containing protein [Pseudomonadales bacterium]MBT3563156.1 rhodanese-like domain-containing protein [Gammaproteobacteria bacterium]MBT3710304.1 rhodanese-like domain-containing protein [Gammaproteobacteria bacterium]MBT3734464.1 rhodanese-like domain-containing protein [Gammaproteobacteria bacterium]|tara:strand:- start:17945 stop:18367 length:423 start_codon:yes stop_codon:yes gene_type:complete
MPIVNIFELAEKEKADIENLSVDQLKAEMADNKDLLLIDIREIQETIDLGTIPGAIHCARGMLEFWASPASPYYRDYFQEDRRTVVFCAGGGRSVFATKALREMGFTDVAHLEPGFGGWKKAEEPIEDVASTSRWMRKEK